MSPSPLAWVLHSPARFIAVVTGGIALLVAITVLGARGSSQESEQPREPQPSVADADTLPTASIPTTSEHPDEEGESIARPARRTVDQFLLHYLAPTSRRDLDKLRALSTPHLWTGLKVADPKNMPRGPVKRIEKLADGAFAASFTVKLPRGSLTIEVVSDPDGPRVASVEPETP